MSSELEQTIFDNSLDFRKRAVDVFNYQRSHNPVYKVFCDTLAIKKDILPDSEISRLPLIPIRVFKEAEIKSFTGDAELEFHSSGTSSMQQSRHFLKEISIYTRAIEKEFYRHFKREETSILCYTPGYAENPNSSLVWMLNHLIHQDETGLSRFLPLGQPLSRKDIQPLTDANRKIVLFGAAFGLIDLIELHSDPLPENAHIVETGGMKTHRREITKSELRNKLSECFHLPMKRIHSEYGMCELLSQSYAMGGEWFESPHWVQVSIRDPKNPERICQPGEPGKIGIIDLANLYSCSFILSDDMGVMDQKGRFKVMGRWNDHDLRGCNFLIDNELEG